MNLIASIRKNSIGLGIFAIVTAGLIAVTHQTTKQQIDSNIVAAQLAAFTEILPASYFNNELYSSRIELAADPLLGTEAPSKAYVGRLDDAVSAIIFETVATGGYNGDLLLLVAITKDSVVTGVRIISHKETPGLGDKVDIKKSDWVRSFENVFFGQPAKAQWAVKKDGGEFDQFTGATITPRAVVRAVKNTLTYFETNKDVLLQQ
ncbi:electron transport complex subunit RsxG [Marinomonas agarivorans]|nr:electron transport complex subunit RsxG [Marinomonas agarivorans]